MSCHVISKLSYKIWTFDDFTWVVFQLAAVVKDSKSIEGV